MKGRALMTVQPPSPPYLGPAKFHGGAQSIRPLKRIVIHGTVSACVSGGARATAAYFAKTVTRPSSAHYVVDPSEVVQVVGDHQIAYHAPPNTDTIGIEHCDPVAGPASRWTDAAHESMLRLSARLTAQLCLAYDVPIRHVGPLRLKAGVRGICGHVDVSNAWHETTHTDPGPDFPWSHYIAMVEEEAAILTSGGTASAHKPVAPIPPTRPTQQHEESMTLVTSNIRNNPDLPRDQVRADTFAVSKLGGVVMWQEIAEQDDRDDLAHSLPLESWTHVGLNTEDPITLWKGKWDVHSSGRVFLHGGKAKVSPSRYVTWVEVSRKGNDVLPPFIVMNTHYVSGAYSHPGQADEQWRVEMWNKAHEAQSALVRDFLAKGRTVIGGGDFNRTGVWDGFAPGHKWLVHGGFDHLWACEAGQGVRVVAESTGSLGLDQLYTDHPARWAHLSLLPPALPSTTTKK